MLISKDEREQDERLHALATGGTWSLSEVPYDERPETYEVCDLVNDLWVITGATKLANPKDDGAFIVTAHERWPTYFTALQTLDERAVAIEKLSMSLDARAAELRSAGDATLADKASARADGMRECLRLLRDGFGSITLPDTTTPETITP